MGILQLSVRSLPKSPNPWETGLVMIADRVQPLNGGAVFVKLSAAEIIRNEL
jgi:hypothetical protein